MVTAQCAEPWEQGEIFQIERQGTGEYRHLVMVRVPGLAARSGCPVWPPR